MTLSSSDPALPSCPRAAPAKETGLQREPAAALKMHLSLSLAWGRPSLAACWPRPPRLVGSGSGSGSGCGAHDRWQAPVGGWTTTGRHGSGCRSPPPAGLPV